jgi:hypothetical protein
MCVYVCVLVCECMCVSVRVSVSVYMCLCVCAQLIINYRIMKCTNDTCTHSWNTLPRKNTCIYQSLEITSFE